MAKKNKLSIEKMSNSLCICRITLWKHLQGNLLEKKLLRKTINFTEIGIFTKKIIKKEKTLSLLKFHKIQLVIQIKFSALMETLKLRQEGHWKTWENWSQKKRHQNKMSIDTIIDQEMENQIDITSLIDITKIAKITD